MYRIEGRRIRPKRGVGLTDRRQAPNWWPGRMQHDAPLPCFHPRLGIGCGSRRQGLQKTWLEVLDRLEAGAELCVHRRPGDRRGPAELVASPGEPDVNIQAH